MEKALYLTPVLVEHSKSLEEKQGHCSISLFAPSFRCRKPNGTHRYFSWTKDLASQLFGGLLWFRGFRCNAVSRRYDEAEEELGWHWPTAAPFRMTRNRRRI